jgi:predicted PurR-regulated permease PerM
LIWGPIAVVLLLTGNTGRGIALLVVGFLLVSGVDNVLRPWLIAGRSQLNGLLVFISVLGGIHAFGFVGVVLGPLLVATAVGLLKGYRKELQTMAASQSGTAGET